MGVQKTALYYYFESKAALYEAVLVRMLEAFDARVRDAARAGRARPRSAWSGCSTG